MWSVRTEQLEQANVGRRPAIHNKIIEDLKYFHRPRRKTLDLPIFPAVRRGGLWVATLEGLPPTAFEILHEDLARNALLDGFALLGLLLGDCTVDGAGEAHAQVDADATVNCGVHHGFVVIEVKVCEEAQGTQRKGQHGGDDPLEEPGREEDGAVTAELESTGRGMLA